MQRENPRAAREQLDGKDMPTEIIGRYEIDSIIGRGAMAVVYRAIDPTIGRTVALKTMRFDVSGIEKNEVLSRFRNEARAAGKLLHPNLVTIYDAGEQEGTFYLAMEYVEGHTLQSLLSEQRFLSLDRTIDILSQICGGLDYAHSNGVIHRDIKPANIMLTRSGVVKIMDFGIAKSGTQLTTGGDVLGTPNYISPEMVKGDPIDGRSDLFSVAVILHEMLLGERPFLAPNISTIIYKIVNEPLSADLETRVHPAMAGILRKALSKHPSDRYQTGADLVNALKSYQALLTQPIPQAVFPGTPITPNWPSTGTAAAPKMAEATPIPNPAIPEPPLQAPEVFGSDVPEVFRTMSPAATPVAAKTEIGIRSPLPPIDMNALTPKPVSTTSGGMTGLKPAMQAPPVFGGEKLQSAPASAPSPAAKNKSLLPLIAIVGSVMAVIVIAAVMFVIRSKSKQPEPTAPLAVAVPEPTTITQTENAKAPEETSKIEEGAEEELAASDKTPAPAPEKKKKVKATPAVAPAPTVELPPAPVTANLVISSVPDGANVQLDGQNRTEKTPFTATGLKAGSHTLILTKPGYQPMTRTIEMTAGNNAALNLTLNAAQTAIVFESNPDGATIFVDEEPIGQVTPATVKFSPGTHSISLFKPGFDEGTGTVNLGQGETQKFSAVLQPADREGHIKRVFAGQKDQGMIIVRSRPRGAHVKIDDSDLGSVTPARIILHHGKIHLTVEKDGFKPFKREVQLGKGDIIDVDAVLEHK